MFWKRRKTKEPLFVLEANDRRLNYRAVPHITHPVEAIIGGRLAEVVDIGAGGIGFKNVNCEKGKTYEAVINLPGYTRNITSKITIINLDMNGICHCYFSEILERDVDALHKYVLEVQKIEIRVRKIEQELVSRN